jgi:hypothetical protein
MLSMKDKMDNAMAVPRLTMTMYQEWKCRQSFFGWSYGSRERFRCPLLLCLDFHTCVDAIVLSHIKGY